MTRGLRNNNPGNIRYNPKNNWIGQTGQDADGFAIFDKADNGIRALARLLKNYQTVYGLNTVAGFISKWAPPDENDTVAYIASVANQLGVSPNQPISLLDPVML